ncbi:hypothetical protein [Croceicoccus naphthovorans]|uniref:Uncharacterized protein n=1 Tax=Croceicoccus naphthovorans TaxID=1348774 RepID=A0A0G3XEF5_9SPHN|nr:hypothetical protein [Croceicoccus naphthovorans]AKM09940.1 hypothetical protein AB433_08055 [Croceicoccus naphthovorans]MBB3990904.1 hypothetical protein [Croceicoccus naphthovorans]
MKTRIALLGLLALAACDQPAEEPIVVGETPAAEEISFAPDQVKVDAEQPNADIEYSYIDLLTLEPDDGVVIADSTKGAGFCTFTVEDGGVVLSVGAPTDEEKAGAAVVRPNGKAAMALYAQNDGSEYLVNGPILERTGEDDGFPYKVTIVKSDENGAATLTVSVPEGERDPYNGVWACTA